MAHKKYQIFVSSTFTDLQDERQLALKAILDLDHIPAGMEAFPAIDMEQFDYVKKVIDECDYYLLIVGARYGSTDSEGVSFTEREFDYAVSRGVVVIALLHNDVQNLPKKKFDTDPALESRLNQFRDKVKNGRMVRFWRNRDQLVAGMMQAIMKAINTYPTSGWIRGDAAANDELLQQFVNLRRTHDDLLASYNTLIVNNSAKLENLASFGDPMEIRYKYYSSNRSFSDVLRLTWGDILKIVGPNLYAPKQPSDIVASLRSYIYDQDITRNHIAVNDMDVDTVKVHFHALGVIAIDAAPAVSGLVMEFISLTEKGKLELMRLMAVVTERQSC